MLKIERIELALENIAQNSTLITTPGKVSVLDIRRYAKESNLKWDMNDIGRSQKLDLIKSLIKHNNIEQISDKETFTVNDLKVGYIVEVSTGDKVRINMISEFCDTVTIEAGDDETISDMLFTPKDIVKIINKES